MEKRLLHIYRNTPLGRETLLQSIYFCRTLGVSLHVYIPQSAQFLMYFEHDAVQVDLDGSYLTDPQTAASRVRALASDSGLDVTFYEARNFTAHQLPDLPTNYSFMASPRSISDLSSKIGLGYIGPKVRRIIRSSTFPVILTSAAVKPWNSIAVFYGGSSNANKALRWGLNLSAQSGFPLDVFTFTGSHDPAYFEEQLQAANLLDAMRGKVRHWHHLKQPRFEENLYDVPHDALLVIGAFGHGLIKELIFGSKMETIQCWMPNQMMIIGPNNIF